MMNITGFKHSSSKPRSFNVILVTRKRATRNTEAFYPEKGGLKKKKKIKHEPCWTWQKTMFLDNATDKITSEVLHQETIRKLTNYNLFLYLAVNDMLKVIWVDLIHSSWKWCKWIEELADKDHRNGNSPEKFV